MWRSWAFGALFVLLWSSGFVGAELAGSTPWQGVLAWRYVITTGVLALMIIPLRPTLTRIEVGRQIALGLLAHVVFLGGVFAAQGAGLAPGTVALVCALQPMLVTVVGALGWGDRIPGRTWWGLALGLVAVVLTVGNPRGLGFVVLLPVASLVGLSAAAILERRWRPRTHVAVALATQSAVSAAVFVTWAWIGGTLAVEVSTQLVGALAWLVALSGIGGYGAFVLCLRHLGASTTSTLLYLTPAVTTIWVWGMLGEHPSPGALAGLTVAAVAVALVTTARSGGSAASHP
ncbi:DMT family transporter [Mobilicoccus sp.]|uniref:DMT family transporter n=1 Tax=Mobilicoccus sp. TaxID=2034349 RepID=UPI0028A68679|nr:DMT family transporter [Mobilicoccus sp.]